MLAPRLLRIRFLPKFAPSCTFSRRPLISPIRFCSSSTADPGSTPSSSSADLELLSPDFALSREWANRVRHLNIEEIGGDDFELISAVQKKFSGGGKASAVDLDLACSVSSQPSQIPDLIDLCYKLRHTDNATDLFPSTEYAIYRLLLEFNDSINFLKIINDPINFGLFMNEHLCCLFLDKFLTSANVPCAAKVAIYSMQQEMFSWPLLNFLAINSFLRWTELDPSERMFDEQVHPIKPDSLEEETSFNEENVRLFRYPFLKNPHFDGHFDLTDPDHLVGKSLEWFSWNLKLAEENDGQRNETLVGACNILGLILQQKWGEARMQLELLTKNVPQNGKEIIGALLKNAKNLLGSGGEAETETDEKGKSEKAETKEETEKNELRKLIDQKRAELGDGNTETTKKLSELLTIAFRPILKEEERKLMEQQRKEFEQWVKHRKGFIESQATRAELMARMDEVRRRRTELGEERELLYFFENRLRWEDEARERDQLVEELGLMKKRGELTEEEYAQGMFHLARQIKSGKSAKEALDELADSELLNRIQQKTAKGIGQ